MAEPDKTAKKTAKSGRNGQEIPLGNHPGNTGGKKGRSGRRPEKYRQWCAEAVNSKKARDAVEAVLSDPEHPQFSKLHAYVGQQGHGTPSQPFEEGTEKPQPVVIEFREHEEKGDE